MKIKLFAIGFIIGLIFMIPIITLKKQNDDLKKEINKQKKLNIEYNLTLKKENDNLKKEINELKELNTEYKWQLEEIPNIIESNKEEICK